MSTSGVDIAQDPSPSDRILPGPNDCCIGLKMKNLPKANVYFMNEVVRPKMEAYVSAENASNDVILKSLINLFINLKVDFF